MTLHRTFCAARACARLLTLVSALLVASTARAGYFTDIWFDPAEPGWGVNVVQSDSFMFLTFFIYGQDGKPTWYTAELSENASGAYTGGLYLTSGTYYALPWNTADSVPPQRVGSVQFAPSGANAYEATLTYVVDGIGTVTKSIQRQTLRTIAIGGAYTGGVSGVVSGCSDPANNSNYTDTYALQVTQTTAGVATFAFDFPTLACSISGALVLHGSMYTITGATYQCVQNNDVFTSTADMREIKATAQGVEGIWVAKWSGDCLESARFSAVLN
jgi:hypothetical protein